MHRFVDVRRHGRPIVLHDPDGLVEPRADDEDRLAAQIAEAVDQVRQRRATGEWLVTGRSGVATWRRRLTSTSGSP